MTPEQYKEDHIWWEDFIEEPEEEEDCWSNNDYLRWEYERSV